MKPTSLMLGWRRHCRGLVQMLGGLGLLVGTGAEAEGLKWMQVGTVATLKEIPTEELAALGDPFFQRVLKDHAEVVDLKAVLALIEPDKTRRRIFVVSEKIIDRNHGTRRTVIDFTATGLAGNVMLAPGLEADAFPSDDVNLEVWGWDDQRGRYNYYRTETKSPPANARVWKFRGSSAHLSSAHPAHTN